jgi:hypothetical protein
MKTKPLLATLTISCAVAALAGCAGTHRPLAASSLEEKTQERDQALSATGFSQPLILDRGTEFSAQAPKHSQPFPVPGHAAQTNTDHLFWDQDEFQPQGLPFFSIRF